MKSADENRLSVLYFGNDWFAENRTSSHHVAQRLAQRFELFYIECPGIRPPSGSGRDLMKIVRALRRFLNGPQQVEPNIRVMTLMQIPLHRFAIIRRLNFLLTWLTVRAVIWRYGLKRRIVWSAMPHVPGLFGTLGEETSVYYCTDDYGLFPDVDTESVRRLDRETTRKAHTVFVTSETLLQAKREVNPNTHYSPHGVDVDHFGKAQSASLPVPDDIANIPRPIIGYFGLVDRWIDLDMVAEIAKQRPHWSFVFIGRVGFPIEEAPQLPNIHFLGKKPYARLPEYGARFDAAIIPYRMSHHVKHINPLKLREYLAMGKPVVAVSIPEIDRFEQDICIARSFDEFLAGLDRAVATSADPAAIRQRMAAVSELSWDARVRRVLSIALKDLPDFASAPVRMNSVPSNGTVPGKG